jgi:glucose-6-phosphate 1-epimerase
MIGIVPVDLPIARSGPILHGMLHELRQQFQISGVQFLEGRGGLPMIQIDTPACRAVTYLHGAHIVDWQPAGHEPVLWMSSRSAFEKGKAIRGGVPICFPWFGPASAFVSKPESAPLHGFARIDSWSLDSVRRVHDDVLLSFTFGPIGALAPYWPAQFIAEFAVRFGAELDMQLTVQNLQSTPITYEAALHTYFAVGDIHKIQIAGLENTRYISKAEGNAERFQDNHPIRFSGECDRVYQDTTTTTVIHDPLVGRKIENHKRGSKSTVVWNPWPTKAQAINLADNEWTQFACVETACVGDNRINLPPGRSHELGARIVVSI